MVTNLLYAELLKLKLNEKVMSQATLSGMVGVTQSTISRYTRGFTIHKGMIKQLNRALGITKDLVGNDKAIANYILENIDMVASKNRKQVLRLCLDTLDT